MSGRTSQRIGLVTRPGDFISRSEVRRFTQGLEKFRVVIFDFEGLDLIGPGSPTNSSVFFLHNQMRGPWTIEAPLLPRRRPRRAWLRLLK